MKSVYGFFGAIAMTGAALIATSAPSAGRYL
jgi:hypothetical protein